MTKEELKESAKQLACLYFDNFCGTAFTITSKAFIRRLGQYELNADTIYELMNGMLDGLAQAEGYHREGINFRASPIENIENRVQCTNSK